MAQGFRTGDLNRLAPFIEARVVYSQNTCLLSEYLSFEYYSECLPTLLPSHRRVDRYMGIICIRLCTLDCTSQPGLSPWLRGPVDPRRALAALPRAIL